MSRIETTFERPSDYSQWHRSLPDCCKVQDIDFVEYRENDKGLEIVAIIETGRWSRSKFVGNQVEITKMIAERLNVPAYFVEYVIDDNRSIFRIRSLDINEDRIMSENEYKNFIMRL